jgi:hypothetical protein
MCLTAGARLHVGRRGGALTRARPGCLQQLARMVAAVCEDRTGTAQRCTGKRMTPVSLMPCSRWAAMRRLNGWFRPSLPGPWQSTA